MLEGTRNISVGVRQHQFNVYGLLGERHQETALEGLLYPCSFLGSRPFLEQRRETVGIQAGSAFRIQHADLAVSFQQRLCQLRLPASPGACLKALPPVNALVRGVSAQHIVQAQGGAGKYFLKDNILRIQGPGRQENGQRQKDSSHKLSI